MRTRDRESIDIIQRAAYNYASGKLTPPQYAAMLEQALALVEEEHPEMYNITPLPHLRIIK